MSPALLARVGEALYGPRWQSALAADLGVSDRTMRRWAAGERAPDGVAIDLMALLSKRMSELKTLSQEFRAQASAVAGEEIRAGDPVAIDAAGVARRARGGPKPE